MLRELVEVLRARGDGEPSAGRPVSRGSWGWTPAGERLMSEQKVMVLEPSLPLACSQQARINPTDHLRADQTPPRLGDAAVLPVLAQKVRIQQ